MRARDEDLDLAGARELGTAICILSESPWQAEGWEEFIVEKVKVSGVP